MLDLNGINQCYGQSHILRDATLEVQAGSCTCLMGRNGVGKSTLLKVIMGLLPATSGSIKLGTQEIAGQPAELRARVGIGYVPQGREIFPQLDVEENLRVSCFAGASGLADLAVCATRKPAIVSIKMRNIVADISDFTCHLPSMEMRIGKSGLRSKRCDRRSR